MISKNIAPKQKADKKKKKQRNVITSLEELKCNDELYKKVLDIAQFESEVDLGVNPKNLDQADISNLSEVDFNYINEVSKLVSKRLNNPDWLAITLQAIENVYSETPNSLKGTRTNNELFKAGKGILEDYLKELEKESC